MAQVREGKAGHCSLRDERLPRHCGAPLITAVRITTRRPFRTAEELCTVMHIKVRLRQGSFKVRNKRAGLHVRGPGRKKAERRKALCVIKEYAGGSCAPACLCEVVVLTAWARKAREELHRSRLACGAPFQNLDCGDIFLARKVYEPDDRLGRFKDVVLFEHSQRN